MAPQTNTEAVDVEQYAGDRVLIQASITRLMDAPTILEGEVSSTGKTILVNKPHTDTNVRLETATIMAGDSEFRGSYGYQLYTRESFQSTQRGNLAPGPQAGANEVSDEDSLPEPTHTPVEVDADA